MFNDFNILIEGKKKGTRIIKQIHLSFLSKLGEKKRFGGPRKKTVGPTNFFS